MRRRCLRGRDSACDFCVSLGLIGVVSGLRLEGGRTRRLRTRGILCLFVVVYAESKRLS